MEYNGDNNVLTVHDDESLFSLVSKELSIDIKQIGYQKVSCTGGECTAIEQIAPIPQISGDNSHLTSEL